MMVPVAVRAAAAADGVGAGARVTLEPLSRRATEALA
jgi:hypothetical protein